jgi:uncharacterized protein with FMN-binding domain
MKRIALAIAGTAAGLAALLSFKSHAPLAGRGALPGASLPGTAPSTSAPSTSAPSRSRSAPSTSAPSTSGATRTIAGQAIQTQYGVVQVQVVVSGNKIKNVSFLQLTAYDPRSQEINSAAAPILLQQTLAAQSSQIDGVSGASYTSQGYVQSLQSALDQAGLR